MKSLLNLYMCSGSAGLGSQKLIMPLDAWVAVHVLRLKTRRAI